MNCRNRATSSLHNFFKVLLLLVTTIFVDAALAAGGESVLLRKTYSGNIDYVAVGASFRNVGNPVTCSFFSPMESTVSVNIPIGATILDAYLYFGGSANITGGGTLIDLSNQTSLTLNNFPISTTAGFNDSDFNDLEDLGNGVVDFFGARRDVSDIVTGAGAYTLKNMTVHTEAMGRSTSGTCLAAWSLVVIYEDTAIPKLRVINLFDGFQSFKNQTFDLYPRNFVIDPTSPTGKMTHMTYEGDETISSAGETFQLQIGSGSFVSQFALPFNPLDNQYNSTVTGPDVLDTSASYGFDLDTYDISGALTGQGGQFEATTRYNSGNDLVLLMAEIISVDNKDLADIELTLSDVGLFEENQTNIAQYVIAIQNNGDGTASGGEATGYIHVYDDLPAGISIDSLGDITAPGWDCSGTDVGANEIRCTYELSTLAGSQFDSSSALNNIVITVDVASPGASVTNIAYASLCGDDPDTCTTFLGKHDLSNQFDPINYFDDIDPTPGLFAIVSKSSTNNNVDSLLSPIIIGLPSDLSTSTKTVTEFSDNDGFIEPNDILEYTITLNETANVSATPVSFSDLIDSDLTNFSFQSSSCGGSNSYSAGIFTMTGMTVPANSACTVVYRVDVKGTATAGTSIDNSAVIANGNGTGTTAIAQTLLVAGTATGSKVLYIDGIGSSNILSRDPAGSDSSSSINDGPNSITFTLSPTVVADLDINSGVIPVSVWVEAASAGNYSITAELNFNAGDLIISNSINNITMATGVGNAQLFPFQIPLGAPYNLSAAENITLTLTNEAASPDDAIFHSLLNGIESNVVVDAATVINVDTVIFYDDVARTNVVSTLETGQTVYIEAVVSDPFGSFDITGADLTLIDPNLANQLTNIGMTEDSEDVVNGTKTYVYVYTIPSAVSIGAGEWIAQVTAYEGTEGTVTHTDIATFDTTAPVVEVGYAVTPLTASASTTLTYSITLTNSGVTPATGLFINQAIPAGTGSLVVTSFGGATNTSTTSNINISDITVPASGSVVITFTVNVLGGASPGDLIDHTVSVDNNGTAITDIAPSVLIDPYDAPAGNKLLYADNLSGSPLLDRTIPVSDTTLSIPSQGGSATMNLAPVLQADLNLLAGDIDASIWVSRGASFAGERTIQATLAYTGASSGTIDSDTVTITLQDGVAGAQYVPFTFTLGSPLTIAANSSLTLTVQNDTVISGETLTVHSYKDTANPTRVALNADEPLSITAIEFFDGSIDAAGVLIGTSGASGTSVWVRATVEDPFGAEDITSATLTITNPTPTALVTDAPMALTTLQPASGAQKYFEYEYTTALTDLGDWDFAVTANEGLEGTVTAVSNTAFNINNNIPTLTDSYKTVLNTTTGDNADINQGDTLHYTIELVESGNGSASGVDFSDVIPAGTSFVDDSLYAGGVLQGNPGGGTISLSGLTVPALGTLTIEFDVSVNPPATAGTIISNSAGIDFPSGGAIEITVDAEDLVIVGAAATGTKILYLENLSSQAQVLPIPSTPYLTRLQPQTSGTGDYIELQNAGGNVLLDLSPPLTADIALDPADHPLGEILVNLRVTGLGAGGTRNRSTTVSLGYHNGGAVTPIASLTKNIGLSNNNITTHIFNLPLAAITTIPEGYQLQLSITNNQGNNNRDMEVYSFDSGSNRSTIEIVPSPVINVDSITFWDAPGGAGTAVTSPDPDGAPVEVYAKVVISDPFGDADIQAPNAVTNPTSILVTDPGGNATFESSYTACPACYAYDSEDLANDPAGDGTRTFYYVINIPTASVGDPRGTWTVQVTANEGLETGVVQHVSASSFSTLTQPNLSTSTKSFTPFVGDLEESDTLSYVITLINTGGIDADNVIFSDTLQSSPISLSFISAVTDCTDEVSTNLTSAINESGGVVSLSNISVPAASSCIITINTSVGAGSPGELVDNIAVITNPTGPGATPVAPTIFFQESQIPVAGSKQLYLDGLGGVGTLGRTLPGAGNTTLAPYGGTQSFSYTAGTELLMQLQPGAISVNLLLSETGNGRNRAVYTELFINPGGTGEVSIDSVQITLSLTGTATLYSLPLVYGGPALDLPPGTTFRLVVTNNQNSNNRNVILYQVASGARSEVVIPVTDSIQVTDLAFYDLSGTDNGGCTPTCGTIIDPAIFETNPTGSIWVRTTIADAFGSADVNTGCDGMTTTNCPTIVITDSDSTALPSVDLIFLDDPAGDDASRIYEYEVIPFADTMTPSAFDGFEGTWQVEVTGSEGTEGIIYDSSLATFERFGPPTLTVIKTVDGLNSTVAAPEQIVTYLNDITNTGEGPALNIIIENAVAEFVDLELDGSSGNWSAVVSMPGYTFTNEDFNDGTGWGYAPNGTCGAATSGNSPCYDPAIKQWRIELIETLPVGGIILQTYRSKVE